MNLVIFIPAAAERLSAETPCDWVLTAPAATATSLDGKSPLGTLRAQLTQAQSIETIIVCLEPGRVLYVETPLPSVSTAKRNALLRYAIEDKLSADPAAIHAVIVGKSSYQAGHSIVAAIDTNYFGAMLVKLSACNLAPQTVVDMPQILRWITTTSNAPKIGVTIAEGHGFSVRDDGYALSFDGATVENPPFALVLALQEFAQQRADNAHALAVYSVNNATTKNIDFAHWASATNQTLNDAGALSTGVLAQILVDGLHTNRKPLLPQMLSGSYAAASQLSGQFKLFKPALWLASAALAVHVGYVAWDTWRLTSARDAVQARMVALFQKTYPEAKAIVDPALQMQRGLSTLSTLKGFTVGTTLGTSGGTNAASKKIAPFAMALSDAALILGTQAGGAQVSNITGNSAEIKVNATLDAPALVDAARSRMAASSANATITVAPASDAKLQQITLTVPLKNSATKSAGAK